MGIGNERDQRHLRSQRGRGCGGKQGMALPLAARALGDYTALSRDQDQRAAPAVVWLT